MLFVMSSLLYSISGGPQRMRSTTCMSTVVELHFLKLWSDLFKKMICYSMVTHPLEKPNFYIYGFTSAV